MKRERTGLNGLYDELNALYFSGKLPRYRVTLSEKIEGYGECHLERRLIRVGADLDLYHRRCTLLHEMCHAAAHSPYHGARFVNQLRLLSDQGEGWAAAEIVKYSTARRQLTRSCVDDQAIEAIAAAIYDGFPMPTFRDAVRLIAWKNGMRRRDLCRKYPWIKRGWRNAVWEARQLWRNVPLA